MTDKMIEVPDHLIDRLKHHSEDKANTAFARSTIREAIALLREAAQPEKHECCGNPAQCWEPCGQLGKSEAHTAVAPDEELRRDAERLDFMDRHHFELDSSGAWKEEPKFGLHEVTGGRNDREWRCVSRGETIRAVIDAAIEAEKREG